MGTQEDPARPGVTLGDVLVVLDLARTHRDAAAPLPTSWEAVIAQIREALVARGAWRGADLSMWDKNVLAHLR